MKRLNALAKVKKLTCDMAAEVAHLSSGAESALKCRQRDELNAENVISKSKPDSLHEKCKTNAELCGVRQKTSICFSRRPTRRVCSK